MVAAPTYVVAAPVKRRHLRQGKPNESLIRLQEAGPEAVCQERAL